MITKDGYPIIFFTGIIFFALMLSMYLYGGTVFLIASIVTGSIFIFHFFFFRDPERQIPESENLILSPADGTVVVVEQVEENDFLKEKCWKISIFLSVFNVHVNRMPVSGKLAYVRYKSGQFLAAFNHRASDLNEQTIIGISSSRGPVLFKQIAGIIARRIIYRCEENQSVSAGERFGMIRYGSRVDVFFPLSASVKVERKDKVKGGISILGEFTT
jgi:phosphatidylserine decarboxylase